MTNRPTHMPRWTADMDAVIVAGEKANLTAGQIARKLRVSRGAVIGRSYRLRGYVRPRTRRRPA